MKSIENLNACKKVARKIRKDIMDMMGGVLKGEYLLVTQIGLKAVSLSIVSKKDRYITSFMVKYVTAVMRNYELIYDPGVIFGVSTYGKDNLPCIRISVMVTL